MTLTFPTALSASRFVLGPALFLAAKSGSTKWCVTFWAIACVTDMCDGWFARRNASASQRGARLDTLADFVFLILALAALATTGSISILVPLVSAAMFGQFWFSRGPLVYDPIGKYYGAFLYALLGVVIILDDEGLSHSATGAFYLFTIVSFAGRIFGRTTSTEQRA
jgi:CDP-diacylglycerol--glycerol-3-phosphate 3-phosphatidyltransferase/cardiolipin synthase